MRLFTIEFWRQSNHRWYAALGCSTCVHLTLIGIVGLIWLPEKVTHDAPALLSTVLTEEPGEQPLDIQPSPSDEMDHRPAGGSQFAPRAVAEPSEPPEVRSNPPVTVAASMLAPALDATALTRTVRPLLGKGQGNGTGEGIGDGDGNGFFGITPVGQRFVYVVDCSRSMNHPHESDAKTRFGRVKLELIKSIGLMNAGQQFFVIFFDDETVPMPALELQFATSAAKQHYLRWTATIHADGTDTDPRGALQLALRLQPDVIYFLSDGSFDARINRYVGSIRQDRCVIHTFAFGERRGEQVLQDLADHNGGKYHFIP